MTKVLKLLVALALFAIVPGCSKKEEVKTEETQVIEVEKEEAKKDELSINASTFTSKVVIDKMKDSEDTSYNISKNPNYQQIENGDFDIAIVPGYLGPYFYDKTNQGIEIAAITQLDNIHIVSDFFVNNQKDLMGKNFLIPDPVTNLAEILDKKIGPASLFLRLNLEYYKSMDEILDKMDKTSNFMTILSDPYLTKIEDKDYFQSDLANLLPIAKGEFVSEIIIVNKDYLKNNKIEFVNFLEDYKESTQKLEDDDFDIEVSEDILKAYDITKEQAKISLQRSNPVFIDEDTMKGTYKVFLDKLNDLDESLVGENIPDDDLYYEK